MILIEYIIGAAMIDILAIIHCSDTVIIGTSIIWGAYMICNTIKDKDK